MSASQMYLRDLERAVASMKAETKQKPKREERYRVARLAGGCMLYTLLKGGPPIYDTYNCTNRGTENV